MKLNEEERKKFTRCRTCGRLVGTLKIEECGGHHHGPAMYCSLIEWVLIKLRINR